MVLLGTTHRENSQTPKIVVAEKIVKYRAICMALDISPWNVSAAVPVVQ